jgi:carnitine O-octanoyltransferase
MNRERIFINTKKEDTPTFSRDESLEKLPLPKLEDTLERYFRNLLPFGSEDELKDSKRIIDEFKNGIGKKLQKMLEEKAAKEKNWVS